MVSGPESIGLLLVHFSPYPEKKVVPSSPTFGEAAQLTSFYSQPQAWIYGVSIPFLLERLCPNRNLGYN